MERPELADNGGGMPKLQLELGEVLMETIIDLLAYLRAQDPGGVDPIVRNMRDRLGEHLEHTQAMMGGGKA